HLARALPHGLGAALSPALSLEPARYAWALAGSLRELFSLPILPGPLEPPVLVCLLLLVGAALVQLATRADARARLARERAWVLAGLAWFAVATGTLLSVYPVWSPERVVYASLGAGVRAGAGP